MVRLIAKSPAGDAVPLTIGALTLAQVWPDAITSVMPFRGKEHAVSRDIGLAFPAPGRITKGGGRIAIWAGRNAAFIFGPRPETAHAAIADQTDGWAVFDLTGAMGHLALARLCPVDTRPPALTEQQTARTLLGHMTASVSRIGADTLRIMVFRSMARTAIHDLSRAMEHAQR